MAQPKVRDAIQEAATNVRLAAQDLLRADLHAEGDFVRVWLQNINNQLGVMAQHMDAMAESLGPRH